MTYEGFVIIRSNWLNFGFGTVRHMKVIPANRPCMTYHYVNYGHKRMVVPQLPFRLAGQGR